MLYLVLALVLAAFGLLIAALTTANTLWAWVSVVLSVVAAALLITDWLSGRRRARAEGSAKPTVVTVGGTRTDDDWGEDPHSSSPPQPPAEPGPESGYAPVAEPESDSETTGVIEPVAPVEPRAEAPVQQGDRDADLLDEDGEPLEEQTDAADLLIVADLSAEVRVVDEHPGYHLANCRWLSGRSTIPIAVAEARQLGFTPCAICGPDAVLAQRHRAGR